jgi:UDP:flavonoid glycosyltransferase YjiC (YdhE family)
VLDRPRYKAKAIEKELQTLLSNPDYARRANEVGSLLDAEDGAAVACEQIERAVFPNRAGL